MELRPYQRDALAFLVKHGGGLYGDPPGTGKTGTALSWLRTVAPHDGSTFLIVAPKAVLGHWQREAAAWYPGLTVIRGDGAKGARQRAREALSDVLGPVALLVNYEVVRSDTEALLALPWDALVCDEAHRLKNRNAQVTKAMQKVAKRAGQVTLVTGTPILNKVEELWSLLRLLKGPSQYPSFWRWVEHYCTIEQTTFFGKTRTPVTLIHGLKDGVLPELREEIADVVLQRPLDELLPDLPEATEVMLPVDLTPSERRLYDQFAKWAWAEIDGEILTAANAVAKITRLRQMASEWGALLDTEGLGSKAKATVELVDDLCPEQVVVLCAYKATVEAICDYLGDEACPYTGDETALARESAICMFKEGDIRVLVGTLGALGEGVDGLQVARHVVLVDRDWTPARNEQAVARIKRSGQQHDAVFVHHVFAADTVDEIVADALVRKQSIIDAVLGPQEVTA